VQISNAARDGNPYTKGTIKPNTDFSIGDSYSYRRLDITSREQTGNYTLTLTDIKDDTLFYNQGTQVRDLLGNVFKNVSYGEYSGAEGGAAQFFPAEYSIGKKWTARYHVNGKDGKEWSTQYVFKVVGKEKITLPAGEFYAFKIEGHGSMSLGARLQFTYWIAPDKVRRALVTEFVSTGLESGKTFTNERFELVSYRQLKDVQ
jgi:hypothetical protein